MPLHPSSSTLPAGRTGHACMQCRHRKQRCGGFTDGIECRPCTTRKVKCSFQEEVKDLRYNPYIQVRPSRSSTINSENILVDNTSTLSSSTAFPPTATGLQGEELNSQPPEFLSRGLNEAPLGEELPKQLDSLKSRIADLERRVVNSSGDRNEYMSTPRSEGGGFVQSFGPAPSDRSCQSPLVTSLSSLSNSSPHSLTSPHIAEGPLKALNSFRGENSLDFERNDPVTRSIISEGEAHVLFRLYFANGHSNAPFLDKEHDSNVDQIRSNSILLFLSILSVGARFWGTSSRSTCWLHKRYSEIIRLLDAELMRVTLRPRHDDQKLETVQALLLCTHWMPFDPANHRERFRSRFSEGGAWQCLGLAIRWATYIGLDRTCHLSFHNPEAVTRDDVRRFRTMLYLVESDHYLALSARRPSSLNPEPLYEVLGHFTRCNYVQNSDIRLASLFRVAHTANFTGCRPTTIESVEAFDKDVQLTERDFHRSLGKQSADELSQHFPIISLKWYRLSYACVFLNVTDQTQRRGQVLTWAIEWSSQILTHLARSTPSEVNTNGIPARLEPDPSVVQMISFAIDHYHVVIAYAAFFLVKSWLSNLMDVNLRPHLQHSGQSLSGEASQTLLFRLVDLSARTLDAASPPIGHLARRYVPLLRGMTDLILAGNAQERNGSGDVGVSVRQTDDIDPAQIQNNLGDDLWEMWQDAGLEPMVWPSLLDEMFGGA